MQELSIVRGTIKNYKAVRKAEEFDSTETGTAATGAVALAAAAVGAGGVAIATAISVTNRAVEADYVEFDINGRSLKGWLRKSPFSDGDFVEAVVRGKEDAACGEVVAVARPSDRTIALYPYVTRGRRAQRSFCLKSAALASAIVNVMGLSLFEWAASRRPSGISFFSGEIFWYGTIPLVALVCIFSFGFALRMVCINRPTLCSPLHNA